MLIHPKLIYNFGIILIDFQQRILKFIRNRKWSKIAETILKKKVVEFALPKNKSISKIADIGVRVNKYNNVTE